MKKLLFILFLFIPTITYAGIREFAVNNATAAEFAEIVDEIAGISVSGIENILITRAADNVLRIAVQGPTTGPISGQIRAAIARVFGRPADLDAGRDNEEDVHINVRLTTPANRGE